MLSGSAADCLASLAGLFPHLLSDVLCDKVPPLARPYDFRNTRPLSEVLDRLVRDLKLPRLTRAARFWRELLAMPQAGKLSAEQWCEVLAAAASCDDEGHKAQLASPARFAKHGHAVESWSSPWLSGERGAAFWGPSRCHRCARDTLALFYFPHLERACEPKCSGLSGRCGSDFCDGNCEPEVLSGGPCVEGAGGDEQYEQPDADRQVEPDEQQIALAEPTAPTKPALLAPKLVASSLPNVLTDDAKRLAAPRTPPPTVKPKRKPLDVGAALAALLRK